MLPINFNRLSSIKILYQGSEELAGDMSVYFTFQNIFCYPENGFFFSFQMAFFASNIVGPILFKGWKVTNAAGTYIQLLVFMNCTTFCKFSQCFS